MLLRIEHLSNPRTHDEQIMERLLNYVSLISTFRWMTAYIIKDQLDGTSKIIENDDKLDEY